MKIKTAGAAPVSPESKGKSVHEAKAEFRIEFSERDILSSQPGLFCPWRYAYAQGEQYRAIVRDDLGNSIRSERMLKVSFFEVFSLLPAEEHLWNDSTMYKIKELDSLPA
jgi:hypothetical protein